MMFPIAQRCVIDLPISSLKEFPVTRICHSMTDTNQTIMDMYLACYSQEEIAQVVDLTRQAITQKIDDYANFGNLAKNCKTHANHEEQ
jgi:hypothetical protein